MFEYGEVRCCAHRRRMCRVAQVAVFPPHRLSTPAIKGLPACVQVVIILNIVFGIIIDTFAQLRDQKHSIEEDTRKCCLICGQDATIFDRCVEGGFARHVKVWLPMWPWRRVLWVRVGDGPLELRCRSAIPFTEGDDGHCSSRVHGREEVGVREE